MYGNPQELEAIEEILIPLAGGLEFRVSLPEPCNRESYFVFGLYKGGSTLLNDIFSELNRISGIPEVGILQQAATQGILPHNYDRYPELRQVIRERGYCYTSLRYLFPFMVPFFVEPRKTVLLVRDPRDILTSAYFSEAISHVIMPGQFEKWQQKQRAAVQEMSIDEFVIKRAPDILERMESYKPLLANSGVRLFRYEDVIFSKPQWISEMRDHLELPVDDVVIEKIARLHDRRPSEENPIAHIRKVTPGDHRDKLLPETITKLNAVFQDVMTLFGYHQYDPV